MQQLNLPAFEFKIRKREGKEEIFDIIRKKYLRLSPEEWVRQHVVHALVEKLGYSKGLLKLEGGMTVNRLQKRSDVVAHDSEGKSLLLVECKAPHVRIDEKVWHQAVVYNQQVKADFVLLTNGLHHLCCRRKNGAYTQLQHIPTYAEAAKAGLGKQ